MKERQQSTTTFPITFLLVSSTDHVSPVTGATATVTISKNGAAFAAAAGAVSEIGSGWYALAGNATDRATLGTLLLHATATGADPADDRYVIVPWNPFDANLALTNLDAAVSTRSTYAGADTSGTTTLLSRVPGTVQPQTGDSFARLGAPAGASVSADVAAVKTDTGPTESGTAQAGASGSITLRSGASATDNLYRGQQVELYGGTGLGQVRVITGYTGATKVAVTDETWITNPDATTLYRIKRRSPKVDASQQVTATLAAAEHTNIATDAQTGLTAQGYTTGRAPKLDDLDATVSSRSTYAGGDTSGTTTLLARLTAGRATNLDFLDAAISGVAAAVWGVATRTLSAFGFTVAPTAAQNADAVLGRTISGGADGGRTVGSALRFLRNKVVIAGTSITVYAEDDVTVAWTGTLTTDATALPITAVDPA